MCFFLRLLMLISFLKSLCYAFILQSLRELSMYCLKLFPHESPMRVHAVTSKYVCTQLQVWNKLFFFFFFWGTLFSRKLYLKNKLTTIKQILSPVGSQIFLWFSFQLKDRNIHGYSLIMIFFSIERQKYSWSFINNDFLFIWEILFLNKFLI